MASDILFECDCGCGETVTLGSCPSSGWLFIDGGRRYEADDIRELGTLVFVDAKHLSTYLSA